MNNLEFFQLLTNLKIVSEIQISSNKVLLTCFSSVHLFTDIRGSNVKIFICRDRQCETYESLQA